MPPPVEWRDKPAATSDGMYNTRRERKHRRESTGPRFLCALCVSAVRKPYRTVDRTDRSTVLLRFSLAEMRSLWVPVGSSEGTVRFTW